MNVQFVQLDYCTTLSDTLKAEVNQLNDLIGSQKLLMSNYQNQLSLNQGIIVDDNAQIYDFKKLDIASQKRIKWLVIQRNVLAVGLAVAVLKIFVFH
jgi:hypothetical protein